MSRIDQIDEIRELQLQRQGLQEIAGQLNLNYKTVWVGPSRGNAPSGGAGGHGFNGGQGGSGLVCVWYVG